MTDAFADLDAETLRGMLSDFAKNWLAHDGVWFQAVERTHGMAAAIDADAEAWGRFAAIEARRIKARFGLPEEGGGLDALALALSRRMYASINDFEIERVDEKTLRFRMLECRVQDARHRKGMEPFPCMPVGEVEFTSFARTIDRTIETACLRCPPDDCTEGGWCRWEFTVP